VTEAARIPDDELLLRSLCGDVRRDIAIGEHVMLANLRADESSDTVIARGDDVVVEIRPTPGYEIPKTKAKTLAVYGLVVGTRGSAHRARLADALRGQENQGHADPFALLPQVLTEALGGRVRSTGHGDLNPRNVLLTGARPYVIDYAKAATGLPQQADFCWLEVGLLRDVLAHKDFAALLRLQRLLALAGDMLDVGASSQPVADACAELSGMPGAFHVLFAIRRNGRRCHPDNAGQPWHKEYLRYLLLAAHRTVKWTDENVQSSSKLRASAVAAAVSTEWLDGLNPFRYWDVATLSAALEALAPLVSVGHDDAIRLLARLVEALDAHGPLSSGAEAVVRGVRERLVRARCTAAASELRSDLAEEHEAYVDLMADPGERSAVSILMGTRDAVLVGEPGSGKTTVARELVYQLASGLSRMPIYVTDGPQALPQLLGRCGLGEVAEEAFVLGAVHLVMDSPDRESAVADWSRFLGLQYPRVRIVRCQRDGDSGQLVRLRPLGVVEIRSFLKQSLVPAWCSSAEADHLMWLLLDDPGWDGIDLRLPLWLSLVAKYVRNVGLPEKLPRPHDVAGTATIGGSSTAEALSKPDGNAALDPTLSDDARRAALSGLAELYLRTLNKSRRHDIALRLTSVVHHILTEAETNSLRASALDTIARAALPGFELFLGQYIDPGQPWSLVRRAVTALEILGVALPQRFAESYHVACRKRLADLDQLMPTLTAAREIREAQTERAKLVSVLAEVESLPWLLRRRFAFGLGRRVAGRLDHLLAGDIAPAEWLSAIESGDVLDASAAAHQLLRHTPQRADEAIALVGVDSSLDRLLITAAAIPYAGPAGLDAAEHLLWRLIPVVGGDRLEGMAALVTELFFARRKTGIRLAWAAASNLTLRSVPERHRWPWVTAMARTRGGFAELDSMLCQDDESVAIATATLASMDFHRCGAAGPRYRFSDQARARLLEQTPTVDWVLAVGAACLTDALPAVRAFATTVGSEVVWRNSSQLGLIEQAELADVLAVAGYLAYRAQEAAVMASEVTATRDMLMALDPRGQHPSVETGRRIALNYLAKGPQLLE
jgi:hypothetical protein